jgi:hypothetical protein
MAQLRREWRELALPLIGDKLADNAVQRPAERKQ